MTVAAALAILGGVLGLCLCSRRVIERNSVPEPGPGEGTASISVIVAVHNEAPRVGALVESLLEQDHPDFEAILVDDRSSDGTGDVLRELETRDDRIQVATVSSRPKGWQGRLYAQGVGAERATGQWLLFLSGDQELRSPSFLRGQVATYERSDVAAISAVGPFSGARWWHRLWFNPVLNNPIFWAAIFLFQELAPGSRWLIGALGIRRQTYQQLGGVEAATTCAAGGFDDWGWCDALERHGLHAKIVYAPALADYSNWTDLRTFWNAFARWQAGLFTYRRGGWIVAVAIMAIIGWGLVATAQLVTSLVAGEIAPLYTWILAATGPVIGVTYSRQTGEHWLFTIGFYGVGVLLIVSLLGAIWARMRNRVLWRDEIMHVVAPTPAPAGASVAPERVPPGPEAAPSGERRASRRS